MWVNFSSEVTALSIKLYELLLPGLEPGLPPEAGGMGLCRPAALGSMSSMPADLWNLLALFTTLCDLCVRTDTAPVIKHILHYVWILTVGVEQNQLGLWLK